LQLFGQCTVTEDAFVGVAERVYATRFQAFAEWKAALKPGDPALDYRFYRFRPHSIKILDEAEFGDAVWVMVRLRP
jgi:murein L,D-transpeptidase YafK